MEEKEVKKRKISLRKIAWKVLKFIWEYNRAYLIWEFLLVIFMSVLPIIVAWYSAVFINKIQVGGFSSIFDKELILIVSLYIGLPLLVNLARVWQAHLFSKFFIFFGQYMDLKVVEKKAELDIQTYEKSDFNNLVLRVNENLGKIAWFSDYILFAFGRLIDILASSIILISYSPWIAIVLLTSLLPDLYVEIKYGKQKWSIWDAKTEIRRKYFEARRHFNHLPSLIEQKIFKTKDFLKSIMQFFLSAFDDDFLKTEEIRTKSKFFSTTIVYIANAIVIFYLMDDVVGKTLLIGTFIFILGRTTDLKNDLTEFFRGLARLNADANFMEDIFIFLNTKKEMKNGVDELTTGASEIEFKNVSFSYPDSDKMILKNLNFKIKKGEKIAIVGVNGAGKTTLTKLILRFYDGTKGEILIGNNNIKNLELNSYYSKVGYLSQEYARYRMKIKDVIAIGNTNIPFNMENVIASAKKSGAHEFIMSYKNGYDTYLGREFEGGEEPSMGQWQKIALARIFYKNPEIWILDEPTASIDAVAEMEIFENLENLPDDKTVILISHRFNTVKNADRIMIIEEGEAKELGSHADLMKIKNGIYKNLFNTQKESFK
ncbi:MAG: ABC transporter ATP-binding protein [Candidatus Pacebacteria bacterium]|nr:ABC transporter ATP-binding protein [Candidatus Paceibacterota bacterium]